MRDAICVRFIMLFIRPSESRLPALLPSKKSRLLGSLGRSVCRRHGTRKGICSKALDVSSTSTNGLERIDDEANKRNERKNTSAASIKHETLFVMTADVAEI